MRSLSLWKAECLRVHFPPSQADYRGVNFTADERYFSLVCCFAKARLRVMAREPAGHFWGFKTISAAGPPLEQTPRPIVGRLERGGSRCINPSLLGTGLVRSFEVRAHPPRRAKSGLGVPL